MDTTRHELRVEGMSCEHCVRAVETEVGAVEGVESVAVDLELGTVVVVGGASEAVVAAIDEAGYDVV